LLSRLPLDAIYASPLRRAAQTAQPIAEALGMAPRYDDRLKEIHVGTVQGMLHTEFDEQMPEASQGWRSADPDFRIEGGETRRELMHRGVESLSDIVGTGLEHVLVVAHGALLAAAFKGLLGIAVESRPFSLYNASLSRLVFAGEVKLLTLNETYHLAAIDVEIKTRTGEF